MTVLLQNSDGDLGRSGGIGGAGVRSGGRIGSGSRDVGGSRGGGGIGSGGRDVSGSRGGGNGGRRSNSSGGRRNQQEVDTLYGAPGSDLEIGGQNRLGQGFNDGNR